MTKVLPQLERVRKELELINRDVTEDDRKDFMKEEKVTRSTLSNYMNGKAANLDLAIKMLVFFRQKIQDREKVINQSV